MSVNSVAKILKLTNKIVLADGSVFKKIERFSPQGVERDFFKGNQKVEKIITRLNRWNAKNWLEMRPGNRYLEETHYHTSFGEHDENNKLEGRGIRISRYDIIIGYW